jgi:hypothetical protein
MDGSTTYRSSCQPLVPSSAAASRIASGTEDSPASAIIVISGVHSQTSISTTAAKAVPCEPSTSVSMPRWRSTQAYRPNVESVRKRPSSPTNTGATNIGSSIRLSTVLRPRSSRHRHSANTTPSSISMPTVSTK